MSKTKKYWTGLDQLHNTPEFQERAENEFAPEATAEHLLESDNLDEGSTKRRDFLKFLGFSVGAATLAACETPVVKSIPYLNKPEEITPGVPNYYASTFFDGTDYASILVKTREGRPIKVVGNKKSKLTSGAINSRVNSSVLSLYDSARATGPMKAGESTDWATVDAEIGAALAKLGETGGSIVVLTETIISPSTKKAVAEFAAKYGEGVKHVTYDAISASGALEANEACFGVRALPAYDFAKAEVVVSFGADFIAGFPNGAANAVGYGKMRDPKGGKMSRHFQFESNMSLAGSNADVRVVIKPSESAAAIISLYNKVASAIGGNALSGGATEYDATISKAAKELVAAKGKGIVVSNSNDAGVQTVVNAINNLLGNYGSTLNMANPLLIKGGVDAEMDALVADMKAGKVGALLIHGVNPSYSYGKAADFNAGLAKVSLTVSFADRLDETAAGVTYLAPDNHYLESWNDSEPQAGSYSLTQPTIQPLFDTRQFQESLLRWAGNDSDYYSYIKANWADIHTSSPDAGLLFSDFFNTALFNGVFESGTVGETPAFVGEVAVAASSIKKVPAGEFELELYVKAGMGDGSQANNPWLQELPDPISRVTWDNYITMSPKQMEEMGFSRLERGDFMADVAELTINGATVKAPVYPSPGQKYGTVGLAVGYGRTAAGKCGNEVGVNAYSLASGSFAVGSVSVSGTGEEYEIAQTQSHHTLMGRDSILKETTLSEYKKNPKAGNPDFKLYVSSAGSSSGHGDAHGAHGEEGHEEAAHEEHASPFLPANEVNLWDDHAIGNGHRWGMTVDLNKCIGCGACVTACGSENNVPVVGKEEVRRGRDMHWLRIDRYYSSDMNEEKAEEEGIGPIDKFTLMEAAAEKPQVAYQPVMCQHCNHAPCETVCPVAATTHSNEGLNMMTYNRCIGTRYCANNCPYKVRRFNWFQYHNGSQDFSKNPANDDLGRMVLNPDVVVRDRGVMEKCSFCVQGIQAAKLKAKKAGRKVADEEVQSACAEACPTNAIVFGDLNDTESWVAGNAKDERSYHLLEEVGVQPNVLYMTKVRNVEENEA